MKPKLVILYGGPRIGHNTDQALEQLLEGMNEDDFEILRFDLRKLHIHPCIACYRCSESGQCIYRDDMDAILSATDAADAVVVASPFYFNSVSALTKTMIDRFQVKWTKKFILKEKTEITLKAGLLLVTAGSVQKKNEKIGAELVAELFFKSIRATFDHYVFIEGTDRMTIDQQPDSLQLLTDVGKTFALKIKSQKKSQGSF